MDSQNSNLLIALMQAQDEAEAAPLDTTTAENKAVVATMTKMLSSQMANINGTFKSKTSYDTGPAGRASNCCNANSTYCACA